jgi:hypothetical protein
VIRCPSQRLSAKTVLALLVGGTQAGKPAPSQLTVVEGKLVGRRVSGVEGGRALRINGDQAAVPEGLMAKLISDLSTGFPKALVELRRAL